MVIDKSLSIVIWYNLLMNTVNYLMIVYQSITTNRLRRKFKGYKSYWY